MNKKSRFLLRLALACLVVPALGGSVKALIGVGIAFTIITVFEK